MIKKLYTNIGILFTLLVFLITVSTEILVGHGELVLFSIFIFLLLKDKFSDKEEKISIHYKRILKTLILITYFILFTAFFGYLKGLEVIWSIMFTSGIIANLTIICTYITALVSLKRKDKDAADV